VQLSQGYCVCESPPSLYEFQMHQFQRSNIQVEVSCLQYFWPHRISSIKLDPLLCVHRHAPFLRNFSSPSLIYLLWLFYFQLLFSNTCEKVIYGFGWLDQCCPTTGPPNEFLRPASFLCIDLILCICHSRQFYSEQA